MKISAPCQITPRLLPGIQVGDGTISIEYADLLHNAAIDGGRQRYRWFIDIPAGEFSSACGESFSYGERRGLTTREIMEQTENADLFPPAVAEWAAQNSDELSMAAIELEEGGEIIAE